MKIIKETDFRFHNLDKLWERWNWDNFRYRLGREFRYVIPSELRLDNGEDFFIGKSSYYIKEYLNLTLQEYFDLMVLHINDTEDRPKCKYCNEPISFCGELSRGYSRHKWEDSNNLFCCTSHRQYYIHQHLDEYPNEVRRRESWTNLVANDVIRQAKASMNRELNHGDQLDLIYFYYGKYDHDWLKYGVTECYQGRNNHLHLINDKVIQYTRQRACFLEFSIKQKFLELGIDNHEFINSSYKSKFIEVIEDAIKSIEELTEDQIAIKIKYINS